MLLTTLITSQFFGTQTKEESSGILKNEQVFFRVRFDGLQPTSYVAPGEDVYCPQKLVGNKTC